MRVTRFMYAVGQIWSVSTALRRNGTAAQKNCGAGVVQDRALNRGWSRDGRAYRSVERAATAARWYNTQQNSTRTDISVEVAVFRIGNRHRFHIDPNAATGFRPVEVWERWRTVRYRDRISDRRAPHRTLTPAHAA